MTITATAIEVQGPAIVAAPITPMGMIQLALQQNASVEVLRDLFKLKQEVEADEAKKAYSAAMASFKAHPPRIAKNKHVKFGNTEYDHATLDNVCEVLTKALSDVGISHRWETEQRDGKIIVTCVLTKGVHSERTSLEAIADSSGSKNAIQAIGSTVTYLQRYTLLAATGMAAGGDTDAVTPNEAFPQMPEPEYCEWMDAINQAPNREALQNTWKKAMVAAEKCGDKGAKSAFIRAKDKAKESL